jgi:hypothetical protein
VDGAGNELLSGTVFPADQDASGRRNKLNLLHNLSQTRTRPDDAAEVPIAADFIEQVRVLILEPRFFLLHQHLWRATAGHTAVALDGTNIRGYADFLNRSRMLSGEEGLGRGPEGAALRGALIFISCSAPCRGSRLDMKLLFFKLSPL